MKLFGLMSHVADQLYKPFGPVDCGLLSDDESDRNVNYDVKHNSDSSPLTFIDF